MEQFDTNIQGYSNLIEIEVGIRDFLISIIEDNGIEDWFNKFIKKSEKIELERAKENFIKNEDEELPYQVFQTLEKEDKDMARRQVRSYDHPFYFLQWSHLNGMFGYKENTALINERIGDDRRKAISSSLRSLNHIRNSICHSRIISVSDLQNIEGVKKQVLSIIKPHISRNYSEIKFNSPKQIEDRLGIMRESLMEGSILTRDKMEEMEKELVISKSNWWANSISKRLKGEIEDFEKLFSEYKRIIKRASAQLDLRDWRDKIK